MHWPLAGPAHGFPALLGPWVCASPCNSSSPNRLGESRGLNFTAGGSHLESQHLQQVTDIVTCTNHPLRAGLFSQDFRDPTVWKQQGICRPEMRTAKRQQPCVPCAPEMDFRLGASSNCDPPMAPPSKSALVLFLLGLVPIQTHSQQDPSGCP